MFTESRKYGSLFTSQALPFLFEDPKEWCSSYLVVPGFTVISELPMHLEGDSRSYWIESGEYFWTVAQDLFFCQIMISLFKSASMTCPTQVFDFAK